MDKAVKRNKGQTSKRVDTSSPGTGLIEWASKKLEMTPGGKNLAKLERSLAERRHPKPKPKKPKKPLRANPDKGPFHL